jgi:Zn-finger nucleic acid-binding protein
MSFPVSGESPAPKCPECGAELKLGPSGRLDAWSCPAGHGIGLTLSEAYERLEDDEIHAIWKDSETAPPGKHACPLCSQTMASVTVAVGGPGSAQEMLDVCREDQFIWFDAGELDEFPQHHDAPPLSADELAKIEQIRKTFDHDLDEAQADEESRGFLNKLANHVVTAHPGFVGFLDHAVYGHELDDVDEHQHAA